MYNTEPIVRVGIIEAPRVRYIYKGVGHPSTGLGVNCAVWSPDFEEIYLPDGPFTLCGVTIGKQFHWEQQEDQTFVGALRIISDGRQLIAINEVPLEDYLASVISSEMAATNSLELLKAHAIISRSWALRQVISVPTPQAAASPLAQGTEEAELLKWWDHDDHTLYDVCADDHCQRYQGITRQVSHLVAEAIRQTRGVVLTDKDGQICDARFYKACGGRTERFSACWQDEDYHYLEPTDDPYCAPEFIATLPGGMEGVMSQILNSYDRSTIDYHEWTERYTTDELSALVERRLHEVFPDAPHLGRITALEPIERGASGRIVRLRIVGTPTAPDQAPPSVVIGKELLVRKVLSESHLKSSWFEVEKVPSTSSLSSSPSSSLSSSLSSSPSSPLPLPSYLIHGHGWGHGVGLCQIGAAAMSLAGYTYDQILAHYYHGATIERLY